MTSKQVWHNHQDKTREEWVSHYRFVYDVLQKKELKKKVVVKDDEQLNRFKQ